ncbi:hypothetical protein CRG98_005636 [Punica granatum]|uniref:Protein PHLOEM PROTEIN 2-LIKE A1-like n=1 Tax=Punica granatum TaxID=22663 RepID=A0A2I0KZZ2_PUNGR|nr:hypothetical protein CRG98_005636 [Punica granatum]
MEKKWIDEKSRVCLMLYARSLYITWGNREYWIWDCFKETTEENIEVAKVSHICWLDVRGKLSMSDLTPRAEYEVVYRVKLSKNAFGWELPVTLKLSLPNGTVRHRQVSLLEKPRGSIIELSVGHFIVEDDETGEVCFDLYEHGGHWKCGLIVHGAIIRSKN